MSRLFIIFVLCFFGLVSGFDSKSHSWLQYVAQAPIPSRNQYTFQYKGRILTGIPGLIGKYSGLQISCNVVFTTRSKYIYMELNDIWIGRINSVIHDVRSNALPFVPIFNDAYRKQLRKPIRFTYYALKVESLDSDESEEEWSLNVKRGIIALINNNLLTNATFTEHLANSGNTITGFEEGFGGECETTYTIDNEQLSIYEHPTVINMTKVRNLENCVSSTIRVYHNYDTESGMHFLNSSDQSMHQKPNIEEKVPPLSFSITHYNISFREEPYVFEGISNEAHLIYRVHDGEMRTLVLQTMTLIKVTKEEDEYVVPNGFEPLKQPLWNDNPSTKTDIDIPPWLAFSSVHPSSVRGEVKESLFQLATIVINGSTNNSTNVSELALRLVDGVSMLPEQDIDRLLVQIEEEEERHRNMTQKNRLSWISRKLFLDAVGLSGTNAAASSIKKFIIENRLSIWEAKELLQTLPNTINHPSKKTVLQYKDLCHDVKSESRLELASLACLVFSKMAAKCYLFSRNKVERNSDITPESVEETYRADFLEEFLEKDQGNPGACSTTDATEYEEGVIEWLRKAKDPQDMMLYLEMISMFASSRAFLAMKPFIIEDPVICQNLPRSKNQNENCEFLQAVAIAAIKSFSPEILREVESILEDIYFNKKKSSVIRIVAFERLLQISQNPQLLLERISIDIYKETNVRVAAYVIPYLKKYVEQMSYFPSFSSKTKKTVLEKLPRGKTIKDYVWEFTWKIPDEHGIWITGRILKSKRSTYPEYGQFKIHHGSKLSKKTITSVEFFNKGLHKVANKFQFNSMPWPLNAFILPIQNPKMSYNRVKDSAKELPIRDRDNAGPNLGLWWKIFDHSNVHLLDEHGIETIYKNFADWKKHIFREMIEQNTTHYVKLMTPKKYQALFVSPLGFPVIFSHHSTFIVSLALEDMRHNFPTGPLKKATKYTKFSSRINPWVHYASAYGSSIIDVADEMAYRIVYQNLYHFHLPTNISIGVDSARRLLKFSIEPELPTKMIYHKNWAKTTVEAVPFSSEDKSIDHIENASEIRTLPYPITSRNEFGKSTLGIGINIKYSHEGNEFLPGLLRLNKKVAMRFAKEVFFPSFKYRTAEITVEANETRPLYGIEFSLGHERIRNPRLNNSSKLKPSHHKKNKTEEMLERVRELKRGRLAYLPRPMDFEKKSIPPLDVTLWNITFATKSPDRIFFSTNITYLHDFNLTSYVLGADVKLTTSKINNQFSGIGYFVFDSVPNELGWKANEDHLPVAASGDFAFRPQSVLSGGVQSVWLDSRELLTNTLYGTQAVAFIASTERQLKTSSNEIGRDHLQCIADQKRGEVLSESCLLDIIHNSMLNKMELRLQHPFFMKQVPWLKLLLKTLWHRNIQTIQNTTNESDVIVLKASYKLNETTGVLLEKFCLEEPTETLTFADIQSPPIHSPSGFLSNWDISNWLPLRKSNQRYLSYCAVMGQYIRTFDGVTYTYPNTTCHHLLVKDCSSGNHFSVTIASEQLRKRVEIFTPEHTVKLTSLSNGHTYDIRVSLDGQMLSVKYGSPKVICNNTRCIVIRALAASPQRVIIAEMDEYDLRVQYDGKNIKIEIGDGYKGRICGLCSNYDGENENEFEGPAECIYENEMDFVNSYALNPSECGANRLPKGKVTCPINLGAQDSDADKASCLTARTVYIKRDADVCFSIRPIQVCLNCKKADYVKQMVEFRCLPDQLPFTKFLREQTKKQVLEIFATNETVDLVEPYLVPSVCEAIQ